MEGLKNIFSQRLKQAHLQFAQANAQTKNCKRACFANRTNTAKLDRQTTTDKEGRTHNTGLAKVAVQCSVGQFCGYINFSVSYESLVLIIATFAKPEIVIGHAMATVRNQTDFANLNRQTRHKMIKWNNT